MTALLSDDVTFRLLGPVEVVHAGRKLPLGAPRQRCVLAILLLAEGRTVAMERIFDAVWGENVPGAARKAVQVYVSNLRKVLGPVPGAAIVGGAGGYGLRVDPDDVDLHRFRRLVREAESGDLEHRRRTAADAMALWHGTPLSGVGDTPLADAEQVRLDEERLTALELRLGLDVAAGEPTSAIPELLAVIGDHPLRESAHVVLMRALHAAGRLGEALAVYRDVRRLMVEELGAEPGPELTAEHQRLLQAQNEPPSEADPAAEPAAPAQLPTAVHDFTGRTAELERLTSALTTTGTGVPVIAATGYGGVGKTTLALQAAHGVRQTFEGGHLYADLQGTSAGPADPAEVLGGFLRAYGVGGDRLPGSEAERASLFRTLTADRRVLVVLDDAADAAQVRPLLPGNPDCAVLVTSRSRLGGLSGAQVLEVGELPGSDATDLLGRVAGRDRVGAEPAAARRIVSACARLPLAVRIAGARLAHRPNWSLTDLADRLTERAERAQLLNELRSGDLAVRASFALGYEHLDSESARAFRLLALPRTQHLSAETAAAVLDRDVADTDLLLTGLTDLHLLGEPRPGRYAYHDLLGSYARELAQRTDGETERRDAVHRAFAFLAATTGHALDTMMPNLGLADLGLASGTTFRPVFGSAADAVGWMAGSHVAVTDLARQTLEHPQTTLAPVAKLARILGNYAELAGVWAGWRLLGQQLLERAQAAGDDAAETGARVVLAGIALRRNDSDETARLLEPAIEHAKATGDATLEGRLHAMIGAAHVRTGDTAAASWHFDHALRAHGRAGNLRSQANVVVHIADVHAANGAYTEALEAAEHALAVAGRLDPADQYVWLAARHARGDALSGLRRYPEAIDDYAIAVQVATELGSPVPLRGALTGMARSYRAEGRLPHAVRCYEQALEHFDGSDDAARERTVAREVHDVLVELGRTEQAATYTDRATGEQPTVTR